MKMENVVSPHDGDHCHVCLQSVCSVPHILTPSHRKKGAGGADNSCGIWAGGTSRGLGVLTPAHRSLHFCPQLCLEFVVKVLDVELVCEALQVAVTFGLGSLQERCIAFIEAHSQEALRTRGFLELSATALLPVLRSDKLCVDETELVQAARSWARVGAVEQIVEAWKCHALRRGDAARSAPCRRRRGTRPRDHHRFLDLRFK
ncbi:BTB/POZ domain-containing protein 19 isoform X4 [Mus musculus]|uniref:BTB/POZ domain-containing protein 19 isoform X4 n=1 Tax=Mus musculus TaxID=10090 RepID=UPI00167A34FA|nr:BTB/POZ domain-containing protein 19 isoform X4 [Mus musculus]